MSMQDEWMKCWRRRGFYRILAVDRRIRYRKLQAARLPEHLERVYAGLDAGGTLTDLAVFVGALEYA